MSIEHLFKIKVIKDENGEETGDIILTDMNDNPFTLEELFRIALKMGKELAGGLF